jgi:hypothetical protein
MTYEIIDNYLPQVVHQNLYNFLMNNLFPWQFVNAVNSEDDNKDFVNNFYFIHLFYGMHKPTSEHFELVVPLLNKLNPKALMRVKGNLYTRTENLVYHSQHSDYKFKHKAAIYYVNDNDGYTVLHDGTKIESVANRMLLFDASRLHNSTNCTNTKVRCNINFNYF